jgi:hypothetical protein
MGINIMKLKERCLCGGNRVTDCDKCKISTCYKCSTLAVDKPTATEVLVFHAGCKPKKYSKEVKV